MPKRTKLEKELIEMLARMVHEHLQARGPEVFHTDFFRVNKRAMLLLIDLKLMEEFIPEGCTSMKDDVSRVLFATFTEEGKKLL